MGRVALATACALLAGVEGVRTTRRTCGLKGSQTGTQIVNGDDADECEWKWQASLRSVGGSGFFCGGMLIDPEWILTAAHCMGRPFEVVFGAHLMRNPSSNWQVRMGAMPISHPLYNSRTTDYDFALVKLDAPVELGNCVGTVCLPTEDIAPGSTCWITGWGTLRSSGSQPNTQQEGAVKIISNDDCGGGKFSYSRSQITDRMLCAQGKTATGAIVDACQGDSGGPLVCEANGVWTLYGATSWGRGCAGAQYPGIWARVAEEMDWITDTMANPPAPTPAPTPAPVIPCPSFGSGPDGDGDCRCREGKCSTDGGATFQCPTSGSPGGWGGVYFLPTCENCQCYAGVTTTTTRAAGACPSFSSGPDSDGDCRCRAGRCSLDGGSTFMCPTSGVPGGWGGRYFLPSCVGCECV